MITKNLTSSIVDYESGQLDQCEMIELFSDLVRTGLAWELQGHYGRTAMALIEGGYISRTGEVLS